MTPSGQSGDRPPPMAVTMGEPAGVGGELTLRAWLRRSENLPPFFVVDDAARLEALASDLGLGVPVRRIEAPGVAEQTFGAALPVLDRPLPRAVAAGRPDPSAAPAVIEAIEAAVACVRGGVAGAVVTNPIHKATLYAAGFTFPGHTEFLAHLSGTNARPVMMLAGPSLRVVPVTTHQSLRSAIDSLSVEAIVFAAVATAAALRTDFGIPVPRLAVAGLNPHAGEDGALGVEEATLVSPAIAELNRMGVDAFGPVPPDTLFTPQARRRYDAAICMYHDQALVPIKTLDFDAAVNVTLGLPFVRTSPDHGTAFDLAGTGRASESSLVAAISLAASIAARRAGFHAAS